MVASVRSARSAGTVSLAVMCLFASAAAAHAQAVTGSVKDPRGDYLPGVSGEPVDIKRLSFRFDENVGDLVIRFTLYRPTPSLAFPEAGMVCDQGFVDVRGSFAIVAVGEPPFPTVPVDLELRGKRVVLRASDPLLAHLGCREAGGSINGSGGPTDGSLDSVSPFPLGETGR
jgi:hypothetical protein